MVLTVTSKGLAASCVHEVREPQSIFLTMTWPYYKTFQPHGTVLGNKIQWRLTLQAKHPPGFGRKGLPGGCSVVYFPLGLSLPQYMCPSIPLVLCSPFIRNYQVRFINVEQTLKTTQDLFLFSFSGSFPFQPSHVWNSLRPVWPPVWSKTTHPSYCTRKKFILFHFCKKFYQLSRFYYHFWRHLAFWQ